MIYFVRSKSNRIRIGTTDNLARRVRQLQTQNSDDVALIGYLEGGYEQEAMLHRHFRKSKVYGKKEWFHCTPDLEKFIVEETKAPPVGAGLWKLKDGSGVTSSGRCR